jgi:cell wall-associated NlpC family hydrolase
VNQLAPGNIQERVGSGVMGRLRTDYRPCFVLVALLVLNGCASHAPAPSPYGARAAAVAQKMVGTRYRYGGESPAGFDCSGLAFYAYQRAGLTIPRKSTDQQHAARAIDLSHAAAGDLLFFNTSWNHHHVAIYLGDGRFVHAPSKGKKVSIDTLGDGYFQKRLTGVGRFDG